MIMSLTAEENDEEVSTRSVKIENFNAYPWKFAGREGVIPNYLDVINFSRKATVRPVQNRCVMCGLHDVPIPGQNKNVCKSCDSSFWLSSSQGESCVIKFCKGCKNFVVLADFNDKPEASKCSRCRQRGRQNYFSKKQVDINPFSRALLVSPASDSVATNSSDPPDTISPSELQISSSNRKGKDIQFVSDMYYKGSFASSEKKQRSHKQSLEASIQMPRTVCNGASEHQTTSITPLRYSSAEEYSSLVISAQAPSSATSRATTHADCPLQLSAKNHSKQSQGKRSVKFVSDLVDSEPRNLSQFRSNSNSSSSISHPSLHSPRSPIDDRESSNPLLGLALVTEAFFSSDFGGSDCQSKEEELNHGIPVLKYPKKLKDRGLLASLAECTEDKRGASIVTPMASKSCCPPAPTPSSIDSDGDYLLSSSIVNSIDSTSDYHHSLQSLRDPRPLDASKGLDGYGPSSSSSSSSSSPSSSLSCPLSMSLSLPKYPKVVSADSFEYESAGSVSDEIERLVSTTCSSPWGTNGSHRARASSFSSTEKGQSCLDGVTSRDERRVSPRRRPPLYPLPTRVGDRLSDQVETQGRGQGQSSGEFLRRHSRDRFGGPLRDVFGGKSGVQSEGGHPPPLCHAPSPVHPLLASNGSPNGLRRSSRLSPGKAGLDKKPDSDAVVEEFSAEGLVGGSAEALLGLIVSAAEGSAPEKPAAMVLDGPLEPANEGPLSSTLSPKKPTRGVMLTSSVIKVEKNAIQADEKSQHQDDNLTVHCMSQPTFHDDRSHALLRSPAASAAPYPSACIKSAEKTDSATLSSNFSPKRTNAVLTTDRSDLLPESTKKSRRDSPSAPAAALDSSLGVGCSSSPESNRLAGKPTRSSWPSSPREAAVVSTASATAVLSGFPLMKRFSPSKVTFCI